MAILPLKSHDKVIYKINLRFVNNYICAVYFVYM